MEVRKSHTYKKSGFVSWLYRYTTGEKDLPLGICKLSWLVALGMLFISLSFPGLSIALFFKKFRKNPEKLHMGAMFMFQIFAILVLGIVLIGYVEVTNNGILQVLLNLGKFIGIMIAGISAFVSLIFGIVSLIDYLKSKNIIKTLTDEEKDKREARIELKRSQRKIPKWIQVLSDGFRAFMDKNCSKIKWVD